MIVIVDYGVGNLLSVQNMIRKVGGAAEISGDPGRIREAEKVILPGVGHFDYGMKMIRESKLREPLDRFALEERRPLLGLCLGAQMLGLSSEEGTEPGLGWIRMTCHRIPDAPGVRVPHMGWNELILRRSSPLTQALAPDARFYFVHSYCMTCEDPTDAVADTVHGIQFTSVVQRGNVFGTQFHPEKSLRHGMALMQAFVEMSSS